MSDPASRDCAESEAEHSLRMHLAETVPVGAPRKREVLTVAATVLLGVFAYGVYLGLPVLLGALADSYHFDPVQTGRLASLELAGLLLGSIAVANLLREGRHRPLALCGIAVAMTANLASMYFATLESLYVVRTVAGFGSGLCYGVSMACLSYSKDPARTSSLFGVGLIVISSLELYALPLIAREWSMPGIFAALGLAYVIPLVVVRWLPTRREALPIVAEPETAGTGDTHVALSWLCLLAIAFFNVAVSAVWAYAERIGASAQLSATFVATTLNVCNIASLFACWLAWRVSRRFGQQRPQFFALAATALALMTWPAVFGEIDYAVHMMVFFQAAAVTSVYQVGIIGVIDASGKHAALIPAAQGVGVSIGPVLGGVMFSVGSSTTPLLLGSGTILLLTLGVYLLVYYQLRRVEPQLAAR